MTWGTERKTAVDHGYAAREHLEQWSSVRASGSVWKYHVPLELRGAAGP